MIQNRYVSGYVGPSLFLLNVFTVLKVIYFIFYLLDGSQVSDCCPLSNLFENYDISIL